jgi:hypothetical protein
MHAQSSMHETVSRTYISIEDLRHTPSEAVLVTKCLPAPTATLGGPLVSSTEDDSVMSGEVSVDSQSSTTSAPVDTRNAAPLSHAARACAARVAACGSVSTRVGTLASDVEAPKNVLPTGWLMFEVRSFFRHVLGAFFSLLFISSLTEIRCAMVTGGMEAI